MFWTKTFLPTLREVPQEAESVSHQLMLRAGLVRMLMAGVYSYLPLGYKALCNIQEIIRQEMNSCGASELLLPALQPKDLWVRSGRDEVMGEVMIRFVDRRGRNVCLGPTHEEVITELVKSHVSSYKQLPVVLYQIQTKFRDEIRPRFGVVRACEFIMKDAYSFDKDEAGLEKNYDAMHAAYRRIFSRCGLDFISIEADPGVMGGNVSHEFMVPAESGEDVVFRCPSCGKGAPFAEGAEKQCPQCSAPFKKVNCVEIGHIFKLGTKYSKSLGAQFADSQGAQQPIIMGCYGIGVSRLLAAVIEQNHDKDGIIWPLEISPYKAIILPLDVTDGGIMNEAQRIYQELGSLGADVLLDDRDERAGVKFKDADLLGIAMQIIIGRESLKNSQVELKVRKGHKKVILPRQELCAYVKGELNGQICHE